MNWTGTRRLARRPSFLSSGPWMRLEIPGATDLTEKGQFTHWNHTNLPVHLLTMFLSSQQVPIDVHQIWRTVVGETERHSQDRKLGEKSKLSQPLSRPSEF